MRTILGLATMMVVALLLIAFEAPTAAADIVTVAAHERKVAAKDARTLKVGHRNEKVERLTTGTNPLEMNREALVSNEGYAVVSGKGTAKLQDATITIGYHVGCAIALANLVAGLQSSLQAFGVSLDGNPKKSQILVVPDETSKKKKTPDVQVYPGIEIKPKVTMNLDVGSVADVQLATAPVRKGKAKAGIERTSIKVEGCIGPIAVRSYVVLTTKSRIADETVVVYGDPVVI